MCRRTHNIIIICLLVLPVISGCADNRHAVPPELIDSAQIPGMPGVRFSTGALDEAMRRNLLDALRNEDATLFPTAPDGTKTYRSLAISGGADSGAYGAGLLKGWSKEGSRPVFKTVTGVSTGALIAPYAFLGSAYDKNIEQIYTNISTKDIIQRKSIVAGLFGDSLVSSAPLAKLIASCATDDILNAIAREHARGRRLFIGTCNIDGPRLVIWDMGVISTRASQGDTKAKELFRKVLLASASIPVTFPPVFFDVEADGRPYTEMHVDGSTITQVFHTYGLTHSLRQAIQDLGIDAKKIGTEIYIIRNGRIMPPYKAVKARIGAIAERAIDTLSDAQAVGDIYRLYAMTVARGGKFNLAYIPDDEAPKKKEFFDTEAMRIIFERGYQDALQGRAWHSTPPGWEKAVAQQEE